MISLHQEGNTRLNTGRVSGIGATGGTGYNITFAACGVGPYRLSACVDHVVIPRLEAIRAAT